MAMVGSGAWGEGQATASAGLQGTSSAPCDFPAAHSMDTTWFAVDEDGQIAVFEAEDEGVIPLAAPISTGVAPDMSDLSVAQLLVPLLRARADACPELRRLLPSEAAIEAAVEALLDQPGFSWDRSRLHAELGLWTFDGSGSPGPYRLSDQPARPATLADIDEPLRSTLERGRLDLRFADSLDVDVGTLCNGEVVSWDGFWIDLAGRVHDCELAGMEVNEEMRQFAIEDTSGGWPPTPESKRPEPRSLSDAELIARVVEALDGVDLPLRDLPEERAPPPSPVSQEGPPNDIRHGTPTATNFDVSLLSSFEVADQPPERRGEPDPAVHSGSSVDPKTDAAERVVQEAIDILTRDAERRERATLLLGAGILTIICAVPVVMVVLVIGFVLDSAVWMLTAGGVGLAALLVWFGLRRVAMKALSS